MRRLVYLAVLVLYVQGTLGCSLIRTLCGSFHQPVVAFQRMELLDVSLTGITVNLHFTVKNDNPVGLKLASLSYNFAVENHPFISGKPQNGLNIPADGIGNLAFPAHVEFKDLAATVETFLHKDVAAYTASGQVGLDTPIGIVNLPISHSGTFDVPKVPAVSIESPTLNNISFSGAHLTLPIAIDNGRNFFPIPLGGLSSSVTVGGAQAFAPSIPAQSALAAREKRVVNLGVDVNFAQAGMAVANAIRSHRADIGLTGNLNVGGLNVPVNFRQTFMLR
jgi:LEA14-like dessication related protein